MKYLKPRSYLKNRGLFGDAFKPKDALRDVQRAEIFKTKTTEKKEKQP